MQADGPVTTLKAPAAAAARHKTLAPAYKASRPTIPQTAFMRELHLLDGRPILVDKRVIGFVTTGKPEEFEGKTPTVIEDYADVKSWCKR
jgi:hypothetical protein